MNIQFANRKIVTLDMAETEFLQLCAELIDISTNYPQSMAIGKMFPYLAQQFDKEWNVHTNQEESS